MYVLVRSTYGFQVELPAFCSLTATGNTSQDSDEVG